MTTLKWLAITLPVILYHTSYFSFLNSNYNDLKLLCQLPVYYLLPPVERPLHVSRDCFLFRPVFPRTKTLSFTEIV